MFRFPLDTIAYLTIFSLKNSQVCILTSDTFHLLFQLYVKPWLTITGYDLINSMCNIYLTD